MFDSWDANRVAWKDALEQCEEILAMCDELPEAADDFALSVSEKVQEISEWIEENEHVTEAQLEALENMETGCSNWLDR